MSTQKAKINYKLSQRNSKARAYFFAFLFTGLLAVGFLFAAWQHFDSMDVGMKNSKLRKQLDQLEAEKRRLIYVREVSLSASEVKKAAKKAGLLDAPVRDVRLASLSADPIDTKAANAGKEGPLVTKTAATKPTTEAVKTTLKLPPAKASTTRQ